MRLGVLVQGQSNAELIGQQAGAFIVSEVQHLLGFDGVVDKVNLVFSKGVTSFPGTAFLSTTVTPCRNFAEDVRCS